MILEKTFYSVACDKCGRKLETVDDEHCWFHDDGDAENHALDLDWKEAEGDDGSDIIVCEECSREAAK